MSSRNENDLQADSSSNRPPRPREFMRGRRPELFSDSEVIHAPELSREMLDYQISILTSKKQEIDFEHFCRRIAEKEICPNLIAQTGPTGGGDSKVDSETYPVAKVLSDRWYLGRSQAAGDDRWAFAFSAKREWRSKVKADVENIVSTGRAYSLIYFITSQYVKDKSRSQVEDQLSGKHKIQVRILDRSWLLKCIFEHDLVAIAAETLHLTFFTSTKKEIGPKDYRREKLLVQTEDRIADTARYTGVEYQLVEECLNAALLSRALDKPRIETDGRFERAARTALSVGIPQQQLRVAYYRAWTAYWWYEDWNDFLTHYANAEKFTEGSMQGEDFELLVTLWQLLNSACNSGFLDAGESRLSGRLTELRTKLKQIAEDKSRPNAGLQAQTQIAFLDLIAARDSEVDAALILKRISKIAAQSEGLLEYPVEPLAKIVDELGGVFGKMPEYDALSEAMISLVQKRAGRESAGRLLLSRGLQKLRAGGISDAIKLLGRAQQELAFRESREDLELALFAGGLAYEEAGLHWAARANTLSSANLAYSFLKEGGDLPASAPKCARRIIWTELRLGRLPHILMWMEFAAIVAQFQGLSPEERESFESNKESQDMALAFILLKANLRQLEQLVRLPDQLARMGLHYSRFALLFALGELDTLKSDGSISGEDDEFEIHAILLEALKSSEEERLSAPNGFAGELIYFSPVLGCRVTVTVDPGYVSERLAERLLAGLEALLATSLNEQVFPYRDALRIVIRHDSEYEQSPSVLDRESSGSTVVITHGNTTYDTGNTSGWLLKILGTLLTRLVVLADPEAYLDRVFGEESGLARSINFSESAITMSNLLGFSPKTALSDWTEAESNRCYSLRRHEVWHGDEFPLIEDRVKHDFTPGEGDPPKEFTENANSKHSERVVLSLINIPLWDKARWRGIFYDTSPAPEMYPRMALVFEYEEEARAIFEEWKQRFGRFDDEDRIRISVITGVDRLHPHTYRVTVGSEMLERQGIGQFLTWSRIQTFQPTNGLNLSRFRAQYENKGRYELMPGVMDRKTFRSEQFPELSILKKRIHFVPAWQVARHSLDATGILPDDKPIIPPGVTDAPVLEVLKMRERLR